MDDGVISRWVAMAVSLVFCVGKKRKVRGHPSIEIMGCGLNDGL
jgi:hypothetical protein